MIASTYQLFYLMDWRNFSECGTSSKRPKLKNMMDETYAYDLPPV